MLVVQFSSVFNHHSLEFADEMYRICEGNYYFVETLKEEEERKRLGYHPYNRPYVIKMYSGDEDTKRAEELALQADVMIAGVFPYALLKKRLKKGKLTFLCQERMFKGKQGFLRKIRAWQYCVRKYGKYKNLYLLSIGYNSAKDYHSIGFFKRKSFLWAYYPLQSKKSYEELASIKERGDIEILFVGRLTQCKHPEYTIRAVAERENVHLTIAGIGELRSQLENYVATNHLENRVCFSGAMSPENIQLLMEKAKILTFTSNSMEGWGAVLSEAMGAACTVVASETAGASIALVNDGVNGMIYHNDCYEELRDKLFLAVDNQKLAASMGKKAYETMHKLFCAKVAAERFTSVCSAITEQKDIPIFEDGPMKKIE